MTGMAKMKTPTFLVVAFRVLAAGAYLFRGQIVHLLTPVLTPTVRVASNIVYYENAERTWENASWFGVPMLKYPTDLFVYREIIFETKPDVIIEAGTARGGSAYYFASLFDLLGRGRVITMDIRDFPEKPKHPRIEYLMMP